MEIEDILAKGAEAAVEQVGKAVSKVTGSPAGEFGELLKDHIRFRRAKNLVKFYLKYQKIVEEAGIDQREVPFRLWFPTFESASIEEDESMQERWAALLANAANPGAEVDVDPSFVETLKQLSPLEAKALDAMYRPPLSETEGIVPAELATELAVSRKQALVLFNMLSRLGLCYPNVASFYLEEFPKVPLSTSVQMTVFGAKFVASCQKPRNTPSET